MGQRHQILIVSKVRDRYRLLAGANYQWPDGVVPRYRYGRGPIQICLRLLSIFGCKANRIPLKHELRAASELLDSEWGKRSEFKGFPFITTCMVAGCSFHRESPNWVSLSPWKFPFASYEPDFDVDMTVIDVSNLERLKYCFPHPNGLAESLAWVSLSAERYYAWYLHSSHIGLPDGQHLVPSNWEGSESQIQDQESVKCLSRYTLFREAALRNLLSEKPTNWNQVHESQENLRMHVKSLREIALDSFFGFAMDGLDFSLDDLSKVRHVPCLEAELRKRLRQRAQINCVPSSPNTIMLFGVAFSGISHLSLSVFSGMTAECLLEAAFGILRDNHIRSVDLSNLTQLSETDIAKILDAAVSLKQIYLMNMPQVSVHFAISCQACLSFKFKNVYHSDLLRLPFKREPLLMTNLKSTIQTPGLFFGRNSPIKHILLARVFTDHGNPLLLGKDGGTAIDWESYKHTSQFDHIEQPHAGQMHQMVIPLHDINLHPKKLVTGLSNFFHTAYNGRRQSHSPLAANQLASIMTTAFTTDASSTVIHQLPATLYKITTSLTRWHENLWPVPYMPLKPGEWAVVIVNVVQMDGIADRSSNTDTDGTFKTEQLQRVFRESYRLAIITPRTEDAQSGYRVESMESFLEQIMGEELGNGTSDISRAIAKWKGQMGSIETCAEEEISRLLPVFENNSEIVMGSQEVRWILEDEREREDELENYSDVESSDSDEVDV